MRHYLRSFVIGAALALTMPALAGETPAPKDAALYIISPEDGATVKSPVRIVFGMRGMGVAPAGVEKENTGHFHLLVDTPLPAGEALNEAIPKDAKTIHYGGGQTETTLELPAGTYALEYRHEDLRQIVTHVVKPKETTAAMVTFDVTVQINARPWAQVYIDGAQRRPLGQTPLSDVKVPIGSALVFENPNFPAKTYRITGKETAVQIAFP